jgi:hypothetical protein
MSAAGQTKIFGMKIGIDPKILVLGLIVLAAVLFWYNSRGDSETGPPATASSLGQETAPVGGTVPARPRSNAWRRQRANAERGILKLRPVDATRGDVDPTIRLDLLARVRSAESPVEGRNLFEIGGTSTVAGTAPIKGPIITPKPVLPMATARSTNLQMDVNIPLKYYGFVRSPDKNQSNRGLFLDNDIVLVGGEGELVKGRYLVVELTPNSARMEDTQLKQGQTLPVVPLAMP